MVTNARWSSSQHLFTNKPAFLNWAPSRQVITCSGSGFLLGVGATGAR